MSLSEETDLPVLDPSGIGEFVKYGNCPMYAKLRYEGEEVEESRNWKEAFQPLSPLLSEEGSQFESQVYDEIEKDAVKVVDSWSDYDNQQDNNEKIRAVIRSVSTQDTDSPVVLEQAHFADEIGSFYVAGDADLLLLWPSDNGVRVRIFDIKASWEEKPYHQIQTATYSILLNKLTQTMDVDVTVETGIITRETTITGVNPTSLPKFNTETRETDVREMLSTGGVLETTFGKDVEDVPHQFDNHCHNCPYNEACLTRAIESRDIRLLGLSRGEQDALRAHGFNTLGDLARVIEVQEDTRPYEYEYPPIKSEHRGVVNRLSDEHTVGERIPILAQKAQALLGELKPDSEHAHDKPWAPWLIGSGSGSLPDDDPHPSFDPCTEERRSMIRVYLNIQWDYLQDNIAVLAARVDCGKYSGTPLTFSETITEIPESEQEQSEQEKQLLTNFLRNLFGAIQTMGELTGQDNSAPVHLYFYSEQERSALMDAVKRYPEPESISSMRDLLGLRGGIDQSMVSILQNEVESRLALKTVSTGLIPVMDQIFPFDDSNKMQYSDWEYERSDGETIQLRDAFYFRLFDNSVPYTNTGNGIKLLLGRGNSDGYYAARARFDAQIPLEYIWAAEGIDEFDESWTDDEKYKGIIRQYQWVNSSSQTTRITLEDIQTLAEKFCQAVEHIERGMQYKNADMEKPAIELDTIEEFSLGESSLARACLDYLDLEYATTKQDTLDHYRTPMKQRILSGKSIPVRITDAKVRDGLLVAEGDLIYDEFDFSSPQHVANSCRQKGSDGSSSGSRMVATPISSHNGKRSEDVSSPEYMMNSTPVSIDWMDTDTMKVQLLGFPNAGSGEDAYRTWHSHYTTDPEEETKDSLFAPGEEFILDPSCDDLTAQRSATALEAADSNAMYNTIVEYTSGTPSTEVERFNQQKIDEFTDWLVDNYEPSPNIEQQNFIQSLDGEVSLLQGPPGTGKTSGAIALAVLARLYASNSQAKGLVTGASNKAVDEMMEDVANALQTYKTSSADNSLDDVLLVRLVGDEPEEKVDGVEYVNYHEDSSQLTELYDRLKLTDKDSVQTGLDEHTDNTSPHVVLFATPGRTFGLAKQIARSSDTTVEEFYSEGHDLFDIYAADEASMLPLPQLLMGGAFVNESAGWQALIAGDQRQMSPVQKHDWDNEDRRTVEQIAPFLSTLDYFRFLRGEEVESLEEFDELESPNVDVPITRLQETYRCHKDVADFLRRWIYSKDGIEYSSSLSYTMSEPSSENDAVNATLQPDNPITLVMHDDESSRQSNAIEATIARELVRDIPEEESVGIVTPHNSQKGLLQSVCSKGQVDTVERFQGGERDVMIVSATVSDPDYLADESDFILNPNRLNVALSRMQKKLIVIAPKSLFRMIPDDTAEYEDATIWKGLYSEVQPNRSAEWSGQLSSFSTGKLLGDDSSVEVYSE